MGQSTWSNDYKVIVYSDLPVMILLRLPAIKSHCKCIEIKTKQYIDVFVKRTFPTIQPYLL